MTQVLLDYYKAIEDASVKMLEAAQVQDWDGVAHCEGVCAVLIEQLRHHASSLQLSETERLEKGRIMRRILANDALIRDFVEPWVPVLDARRAPSSALLH